MRRSAAALAVLLVAAAQLSACTREVPPEDRPENLLVSVFLDADATPAQSKAVEDRLRAVPDIVDLSFVSRQAAYEKIKADTADRPDLLESVKPEHMPESWALTVASRPAFERLYRGPLRGDLRQLDGVDSVVFRGKKAQASVAECVMTTRTMANPAPQLDIAVFLTMDTSGEEKQAIESRLRAVPGASDVRLRSREEGYEILKKTYRDIAPGIAASAGPEDLPEVLVLTMVDRPAVFRANDDRVDEQICRMAGVDRVIVPPKPLASRATS
ncbi:MULTISPECIES: permease-like cell division protein FtsX [unclassified Micromonospora]|uniref:permease-like cell division protein FtsX n=1 Tax=unclassified Micromonospora TaxID=2617518 RepID=UPI0033174221